MMSAALYTSVITLFLGLTAWSAERVLASLRWPRRGAWLAALLLSVAIPAWRLPGALPQESPVQLPRPFPALRHATVRTGGPGRVGVRTLAARVRPSPGVRPSRHLWTTTMHKRVLLAFVASWGVISAMLLLRLLGAAAMLHRRAPEWAITEVDGTRVSVTDHLGPAVLGVLRPRIVVPAWFLTVSAQIRQSALMHEREHVRAQDGRWLLLSRLLIVLMPWNLPLWWLERRVRFAIEVDCDARVVRGGSPNAAYAEALLALAERMRTAARPAIGLFERRSLLARRIGILTARPQRWWRWAALPAYVLSAVSALAAVTLPSPPISAALGEQNAAERYAALLAAARFNDARTIGRLLANGTPDALAAATLIGWPWPTGVTHSGLVPPPDAAQRLAWMRRALAAAPRRADLLLLELNECTAWKLRCASAALLAQLGRLAPDNGAAALESLRFALRAKSGSRIDAALAAIGKSQRVDTYYTQRLSRLARALHQVGGESSQTAYEQVNDSDLSDSFRALLAVNTVCNPSSALTARRISLCRAASRALERGDTLLAAQTGASIALRLWPVGTQPHRTAARLHRQLDFMEVQSRQLLWPPGHHVEALFALADGKEWARILRWSAQCRSEQGLLRAQLRRAGLATDPPSGWRDPYR